MLANARSSGKRRRLGALSGRCLPPVSCRSRLPGKGVARGLRRAAVAACASLWLPCAPRPCGPRHNSLRSLRSLRSDNCRESVVDARCARGHKPCGARRHTCAPQPPGYAFAASASALEGPEFNATNATMPVGRCAGGLWVGCVRSREAEPGRRTVPADCSSPGEGHGACKRHGAGPMARARQRASSSCSRQLSERSERSEHSEMCRGASGSSIAGQPRRSQAVCPPTACRRSGFVQCRACEKQALDLKHNA